MKYLIDIYHLPQFNLFKNAIKIIGTDKVEITCVNRGKLVEVIKYEFPEARIYIFGDYKNNKNVISLIFKIIIPRIFNLWKLIIHKKYSRIISASYQANLISKILRIPNFAIIDDPRKWLLMVLDFSTNEYYLPLFSQKYGKAKNFAGLKEWAYLSPRYFKPSPKVLDEYGLRKKKYLFFREVVTNTSNYLNQKENLVLELSKKLKSQIKVVLSLENKKIKNFFPSDWIILNEPVSDIYSLMYYSKIVISSGDSMAREGAMLGVPSIYLGTRDMPANRVLIKKGILHKLNIDETLNFIENFNVDNFKQEKFREQLDEEWEDITQLILNLLTN